MEGSILTEAATKASHATGHPYYPRDIVLDHYVPNTFTPMESVARVFALYGAIIVGSLLLGFQKRNSTIRGLGCQLTFVWFMLCGFTHFGLEAYFGIYHKTMAGRNSLLAQIWKEYSHADSRYLTSDPCVLGIELITAFAWGPLAFYAAYAQYRALPSRYIVQLVISLGQLYGSILYYFTTLIEGAPHGNPHPYYFYFYFIHFNAWWVIVPIILMYTSMKNLYRASCIANQSVSADQQKKRQ